MGNLTSLLEMPRDCLTVISTNNPFVLYPFSQTCTLTRSITLELLAKANLEMTRAFSTWNRQIEQKNDAKENPMFVFMRLVNNLHDEAEHLKCNRTHEESSSLQDRVAWEFSQALILTQEVTTRMVKAKSEDFSTFVTAVANQAGINIPIDMVPRTFWEDVLKDNVKVKQLKTLNLFNKGLRFLPKEIVSLSNLEYLYLGENQIKDIPTELVSLTHLKLLDLSSNQLSQIPDTLPFPVNLTTLKLKKNKITHLPESFAALSKVLYLDVSQNPFKDFPLIVFSLSSLKHLYINEIGMSRLPEPLTLPVSLEGLYMSNNNLTELPYHAIAALSCLRKLYMYRNPLADESKNLLSTMLENNPGLDLKWVQEVTRRWDE